MRARAFTGRAESCPRGQLHILVSLAHGLTEVARVALNEVEGVRRRGRRFVRRTMRSRRSESSTRLRASGATRSENLRRSICLSCEPQWKSQFRRGTEAEERRKESWEERGELPSRAAPQGRAGARRSQERRYDRGGAADGAAEEEPGDAASSRERDRVRRCGLKTRTTGGERGELPSRAAPQGWRSGSGDRRSHERRYGARRNGGGATVAEAGATPSGCSCGGCRRAPGARRCGGFCRGASNPRRSSRRSRSCARASPASRRQA